MFSNQLFLKRLLFIGLCLTGQPSFAKLAGHAGGNGGDSYVDEFKAIRNLVMVILRAERPRFQRAFNYTDTQYNGLLNAGGDIHLIRRDRLDAEVIQDGRARSINALLPLPINQLFVIENEPKQAVNFSVNDLDFIIIDTMEWSKLDGKFDRKVRLMAHEVFGIFGLEQTGETPYSRMFDEATLRRYPFADENDVPNVLIASVPFEHEMPIGLDESCNDAQHQATIKALMTTMCKPYLPLERPSPFYSYSCVFDGSMQSPLRESYQTTHTTIYSYVPPRYDTTYRETQIEKHRYTPYGIRSFYKSYSERTDSYTPGYPVTEESTTTTPILTKSCYLSGSVSLIGIDPIQGDSTVKLLAKSQGTYEGILLSVSERSAQLALDQCFAKRKQLPRGLVNESYCNVFHTKESNWQWEMWGMHPYRSAFQPE